MKLTLAVVIAFFTFSIAASQIAITDEGEVVILNTDGTWHYEDAQVAKKTDIQTNSKIFSKPKSASFTLKSTKTNSAFSFEPKKWSFVKNTNSEEPAEYNFTMKGTDLYAMAISEEIEIDLVELTKIAFNNARAVAPDTRITKQEYRTVNGQKVIYMEMEGTMQSIKFTYLGYYFSNATGSTQFITYTGTNLVAKYRPDIEDFLNGYALQK